jgi:hypothetical protein
MFSSRDFVIEVAGGGRITLIVLSSTEYQNGVGT